LPFSEHSKVDPGSLEVNFSFALDYLANDIRPRGYGFTNLALYLGRET